MVNVHEVVGFRKYEGEYEGKAYSGYFVHCVTDSVRQGFQGRECVELKIKGRIGYTPVVGDRIIPQYNQYGLCDIEVM